MKTQKSPTTLTPRQVESAKRAFRAAIYAARERQEGEYTKLEQRLASIAGNLNPYSRHNPNAVPAHSELTKLAFATLDRTSRTIW